MLILQWRSQEHSFCCFILDREILETLVLYCHIFQANIGVIDEESVLKLALHHGKMKGLLKPGDKVVVFQKIGDSSVVKIVEFDG